MLAAWDWEIRPTAVLGLDSVETSTADQLARCERLAQLGRLTNLGTLQYSAHRRPVAAANSAYRVAALHDSWVVPDPATLTGWSGPVLLVDDMTDTGWTLTMAARVLRGAGVEVVLPFAMASVKLRRLVSRRVGAVSDRSRRGDATHQTGLAPTGR